MKVRARKTAIALTAFAVAGSTLFGGVAMAGGHAGNENQGGPGGSGGTANANCLIPIGLSLGLLAGQGGDVSQCNATGGVGGAGGGADY